MELAIDITLTKKQQEIYDAIDSPTTRVVVANMSRQIGKSVISEILLIQSLFFETRTNRRFSAYISPTFSQGRKVYSEIVGLLEPTGCLKKANAATLSIEMTNGNKLQFFSMESPTAIRGYTICGLLVLDECAFFPDVLPDGGDPWSNIILPITKARRPKILIISTPNGKRGMFYDLYLRAKSGEMGFKLVEATIYDDELITKEQVEEIKKSVSPLAWEQEFMVRFLDNALSVFDKYPDCFDIDTYSGGRCWCGIDPSANGEDATILTLVNDKNEVRQFVIDGTLDDKYRKIASIVNKNKPVGTYLESNSIGAPFYNEIRKLVDNKSTFVDYLTTNQNKKDNIGRLAIQIANREIHFERDNTLLYSELGTYSFKISKSANIIYNATPGHHDDTVMSLAIALKAKDDFMGFTRNKTQFIISNNRSIY